MNAAVLSPHAETRLPVCRHDLRLLRRPGREIAAGRPRRASAAVNLATEQARVAADASVSVEALAAAVRKAGYDVAERDATCRSRA